MNFLNPFDLLGLAETEPTAIKKAKRRKLLEFDLSDDGLLDVGNCKVTKSNFLRVTDELDNKDKVEFYFFIKSRPRLNAFLKNGDPSFFAPFRYESLYSDQDFIGFVSPYFAEQYSKLLLSAFRNKDVILLRQIVTNPVLTSPSDVEKAYKGLSDYLKSSEKELQAICDEIHNEEGSYREDNMGELEPSLRKKIDIESINILPDYFQLPKNNLAQKLRNISVAVFNSSNDAKESLRIISFAREVDSNSLIKQNLQKDYEQIKEIYESRKESEKYTSELTKYAHVLIQIVQLIKNVEADQIKSPEILSEVNSLLSVHQLNQLPNVFDEIREQIAMAIRGLSVAIWNEENDISTAIELILLAQKIRLDLEVKEDLRKAQNELYTLRDRLADPILEVIESINKTIEQVRMSHGQTVNTNKLSQALTEIFSSDMIDSLCKVSLAKKEKILSELKPILVILPSSFVKRFLNRMTGIIGNDRELEGKLKTLNESVQPSSVSTESPDSGCLLALTIGVITLVFIGIIGSGGGNSSTPAKNTSPRTYVSPSNSSPSPQSLPPPVAETPPVGIKKSRFLGNQLKNGASPFDGCFGKGKYRGSAWILFKNDNSSDAIVCLVNVNSGNTIRNEYIRAGANFKMTQVPKGTYYLKVFYGRDWNPNITNACGTKGAFETDAHFSKSETSSDWIQVEDNDYSYTTGEITLYTVAGGNMSQSPTNARDFFNN